ncbi:MAG: hypothetical protein ACRECZ_09160, partial [Methylocella sp.]
MSQFEFDGLCICRISSFSVPLSIARAQLRPCFSRQIVHTSSSRLRAQKSSKPRLVPAGRARA